ncbi:MAG TPA: peptide-methionine (S)-S-oxide reductase MsrA [Candidatus Binataceae bacterium]|nr:peptide-methionine (S)-S-oxide reductase MsrA [Candidatus Binataceae bacterium]
MREKTEVAVFGGGCFWCTEAVFERLKGVISVKPGFAGGTTENPTYPQVCTGTTGHAEVSRVEYDPQQISYNDLLTVFFATHDPTTLNRQGADVGTEYRSIIFYTAEEQKREAEAFISQLQKSDPTGRPIVTEVRPLTKFYEAEDYHHEYYRNNPYAPYCQVVISPKMEKLNKKFDTLLKASM